MPGPDDFDTAAVLLDRAEADIRGLVGPARALVADGVIAGGQLTTAVSTGLDAAEAALIRAGAELSALADACRQRAQAARDTVPALTGAP